MLYIYNMFQKEWKSNYSSSGNTPSIWNICEMVSNYYYH